MIRCAAPTPTPPFSNLTLPVPPPTTASAPHLHRICTASAPYLIPCPCPHPEHRSQFASPCRFYRAMFSIGLDPSHPLSPDPSHPSPLSRISTLTLPSRIQQHKVDPALLEIARSKLAEAQKVVVHTHPTLPLLIPHPDPPPPFHTQRSILSPTPPPSSTPPPSPTPFQP